MLEKVRFRLAHSRWAIWLDDPREMRELETVLTVALAAFALAILLFVLVEI